MADESAEGLGDDEIIASVARALRVLQIFDHEHPQLSVSDVARLSGLTRGTARRILVTFESLGFMRLDGRMFALTPRVLRLGYGYLASLPTWELAQPRMRALADALNESCSLATLDCSDMVYVARVPSRRNMSITLTVGSRLPAYATSMGRVLLAGLPEHELANLLDTIALRPLTARTITDRAELLHELKLVRRQGFAIVDGEREEGVLSAAAPVRNGAGGVIAALNVSTSAGRVTATALREFYAPRVVETAEWISQDLAALTQ